jgi:hypothetical protein
MKKFIDWVISFFNKKTETPIVTETIEVKKKSVTKKPKKSEFPIEVKKRKPTTKKSEFPIGGKPATKKPAAKKPAVKTPTKAAAPKKSAEKKQKAK